MCLSCLFVFGVEGTSLLSEATNGLSFFSAMLVGLFVCLLFRDTWWEPAGCSPKTTGSFFILLIKRMVVMKRKWDLGLGKEGFSMADANRQEVGLHCRVGNEPFGCSRFAHRRSKKRQPPMVGRLSLVKRGLLAKNSLYLTTTFLPLITYTPGASCGKRFSALPIRRPSAA